MDEQTPGAGEEPPESDEDDDEGGLPVSRRALLGAGGVAGAGIAALAMLGGNDTDTPTPPGDDGTPTPTPEHLPYDVWDEMRAALRTSPDHLPARAERLVEAGDTEAIFTFVRDETLALPVSYTGVGRYDFHTRMFWGARGTLRGGAGTPRDRAELLAHLYREAGVEAEVVVADAGLSKTELKALYFRPVDHAFDPDIDEAQVDEWLGRVGRSRTDLPEVSRLDPDGEESAALGQRLADAMPEGAPYDPEFEWETSGELPVVRFRESPADEFRYANLYSDVPFGEAGTSEEFVEAAEPASPPEVSVTLSAARSDAPHDPFELVSNTWAAEEVVGRRVIARTLPGIDPFTQPAVRAGDIDSFVPSLSVQGADLDRSAAEALSTLGDAVTKGGDRLSVGEDGTVTRNGRPIGEGDAVRASRIESLGVTADPGRYPDVRLYVDARDADGESVEGLPAGAFSLHEEDEPAAVTVVASSAAPRVRVLADRSLSMPNDYYGAEMTAFVEELGAAIRDVDPDSHIEYETTDSNVWTAAGEAAGTDANLVVYATDGDVGDEETEAIAAALSTGPPVVMLSVDDTDEVRTPAALDIAARSGGVAIPADDREATLRTLREYVTEIAGDLPAYTLEYTSPTEEQPGATRAVELAAGEASAETTYEVPARSLTPPRLSTLSLTVSVGGRSTTRVLAGYDPELSEGWPTDAHVESVEGALFGSTVVTFEGMATPTSVALDEFLQAKSSTRDLDAAIAADDEEAAEAAADAGLEWVPPEAFLLTPPLPEPATEEALTFPDGMRVARYTQRPVFGAEYYERVGDVLALTRYGTVTADESHATAFRRTLDQTATIAVAEAAGFDESTADLLGDTPLSGWSEVDEDAWVADGVAFEWWEEFLETTGFRGPEGMGRRKGALVPADGSVRAYWSLDLATGSVLGVLPDGTNGAFDAEPTEAILLRLNRVVTMLNLLCTASGAGGLSMALVAAYGQILARLYVAASLSIAVMDADAAAEGVGAARVAMACTIAKEAFLDVVKFGSLMGSVEGIVGLSGANLPTSC